MSSIDSTLLTLFAQEVKRAAQALGQASERGDAVSVGRVLGVLRSAASLVGLIEVTTLADAADVALHDTTDQRALCQQIAALLERFDETPLELWLAQLSKETSRWRDAVEPAVAPEVSAPEVAQEIAPRSGGLAPTLTRQSASMLTLFQSEVALHAKALVDGLLELERGEHLSNKLVEGMMRAAHAIKGAARVVKASRAVNLAHAMEELLSGAKEHAIELGSAEIDLLLACTDALQHAAANATHVGELGSRGELASLQEQLSDATPPTSVNTHARPGTNTNRFSSEVLDLAVSTEQALLELTTNTSLPWSERPAHTNEEPNTEVEPVKGGAVTAAPIQTASALQPAPTAPGAAVSVNAARLANLLELSGELLVRSYGLPAHASDAQAMAEHLAILKTHVRGAARALNQNDLPAVGHSLAWLNEGLDGAHREAQRQAKALDELAQTQQHLQDRLHREAMASTMRPIGDLFAPYPRMVRDLARSTGKPCSLEVAGASTLVDRDLLKALEGPLMHLLSNAIGHGIEPPAARKRAGKTQRGRLRLSAQRRGDRLIVELADDGRGIDLSQLRQQIIARELASRDVAMRLTDAELYEFLFLPGFSTASEVGDLSGRGGGLDVTQQAVKGCGGTIAVRSRPGAGTTFTLTLPLTRSVVSTLVVDLAQERYAFDARDVEKWVRVDEASLMANGRGRLMLEDGESEPIPLLETRELLELDSRQELVETLEIVILAEGEQRYGLVVDRVHGAAKLLQRPLDARLGRIPGINGAALMAGGDVVLLLDGDDLRGAASAMLTGRRAVTTIHGDLRRESGRPRILVVDDSPTIREELSRLLTARGFDVDLAIDGMDGWAALGVQRYVLLITDIDMPRMSGLELLQLHKQRMSQTAAPKVPAIVISYKATADDRAAGLDAGAQCYLSKSDIGSERFDLAIETLVRSSEGQP